MPEKICFYPIFVRCTTTPRSARTERFAAPGFFTSCLGVPSGLYSHKDRFFFAYAKSILPFRSKFVSLFHDAPTDDTPFCRTAGSLQPLRPVDLRIRRRFGLARRTGRHARNRGPRGADTLVSGTALGGLPHPLRRDGGDRRRRTRPARRPQLLLGGLRSPTPGRLFRPLGLARGHVRPLQLAGPVLRGLRRQRQHDDPLPQIPRQAFRRPGRRGETPAGPVHRHGAPAPAQPPAAHRDHGRRRTDDLRRRRRSALLAGTRPRRRRRLLRAAAAGQPHADRKLRDRRL